MLTRSLEDQTGVIEVGVIRVERGANNHHERPDLSGNELAHLHDEFRSRGSRGSRGG